MEQIKVLHLSTYDQNHGAAIAARRIHQSLLREGIKSSMLVKEKYSREDSIHETNKSFFNRSILKIRSLKEKKLLSTYSHEYFSPGISGYKSLKAIRKFKPDIVHLHWITSEFLSIQFLHQLSIPVIWTLQDCWAFTGGCHYFGNCDKFTSICSCCPVLHSKKKHDLSTDCFLHKQEAYNANTLFFTTPSQWMFNQIRQSSLLKHAPCRVIPNSLDLNVFKPFDKKEARKELKIPADKKIILFGALHANTDKRKGWDVLSEALSVIPKEETEVVVFGAKENGTDTIHTLPLRLIKTVNNPTDLAKIYSSADVMITPSLQEAFGQTASESLACGTPVVAFDGTGVADIVDHTLNGFLAKNFSPEALADGIQYVLSKTDSIDFKTKALEKVQKSFNEAIVAKKYISLYKSILQKDFS